MIRALAYFQINNSVNFLVVWNDVVTNNKKSSHVVCEMAVICLGLDVFKVRGNKYSLILQENSYAAISSDFNINLLQINEREKYDFFFRYDVHG